MQFFFPDGMFETSQTLYVPLGVGWVSRDRVDPLGRERLSAPRRSPQYVIARIDKEGTGESTFCRHINSNPDPRPVTRYGAELYKSHKPYSKRSGVAVLISSAGPKGQMKARGPTNDR